MFENIFLNDIFFIIIIIIIINFKITIKLNTKLIYKIFLFIKHILIYFDFNFYL
jgi:hypothetical protein